MIYFETERLRFRDWTLEDLPPFRKMNKNPQVMQYFPAPLEDAETDAFFDRIQNEFKDSGYGLYAVELIESGEFIGFIGFHEASFKASFTPCIEIGWRLKASAFGKGYATEGARACLDYGFKVLKFTEVYSFTAKINLPSERVMQKIGMTKAGEFEHPTVQEGSILKAHVLYHTKA